MMIRKQPMNVRNKHIHLFGNPSSRNLIIQPVDEHDLSMMEEEVEETESRLGNDDFFIVAFQIEDWNQELTPWEGKAVFGKVGFGSGAKETLSFILEELIPYIQKNYGSGKRPILAGYSLAGLFALWCSYQTDAFDNVAAVSPSVWYYDWIDYASAHPCLAKTVYLSLGDKEEKAKNPMMARVGECIRKQHELLLQAGAKTVLEMNPGNHFVDAGKRVGKGLGWLLNN